MAYPARRQTAHGLHYTPAARNNIRLTLAFAKAVGTQQQDKAENLVVSPYNAATTLAMVAKGAEATTRDELAQALFGSASEGLDAAAGADAALNAQVLTGSKGQVELTSANAVWTNRNAVTLRPEFARDIQATFGANISAEDFKDPATVKKINAWAAANTNGLIKDIIGSLKPEDAAVLASALYFKGEWTRKFDKALTMGKPFTPDQAATAETPMMHRDFRKDDGLMYQAGTGYEAVALTYGATVDTSKEFRRPALRLVLVRPTDAKTSARDFLAAQDAQSVPAWLDTGAFEKAVGAVELPRLDITQKHDLIPALQDMGVKAAFGNSADFSRMTEKDGKKLFVSKVSHDVVFKTDENGSEAAAVTTTVMTLRSMPRPLPFVDVRMDRSFVFAVQDIDSGAVLFVGAVNKPNNDMKPAKPAPKP